MPMIHFSHKPRMGLESNLDLNRKGPQGYDCRETSLGAFSFYSIW